MSEEITFEESFDCETLEVSDSDNPCEAVEANSLSARYFKIWYYDSLKTGDCESKHGSYFIFYENGSFEFQLQFRSTDTNDNWCSHFSFREGNGDELFQYPPSFSPFGGKSYVCTGKKPNANTWYTLRFVTKPNAAVAQKYYAKTKLVRMYCKC